MFLKFTWIKLELNVMYLEQGKTILKIGEQCRTILKIGNYELWISRTGIGVEDMK